MTSRTFLRTIIVCLSATALFACNRHHGQDNSKSQAESASPEVPKVVLEAKPPPDAVSLPSGTDLATTASPQQAAPNPTPTTPQVDPVIADAQKQALDIDAKLEQMHKRDGEWTLGDAHSTYSAYSQDKDPSVIEEHLDLAGSGSSRNKYYFKDGNLYLYEEDGNWSEIDPPNPITTRHIKRTMVFDSAGKLVTAAKLVDGAPAPVQGYEANAVLERAVDLRNAAMAPPPKAATAEAPSEPPAKAEKPPVAAKPAAAKAPPKPEKKAQASTGSKSPAAGDNRLHLQAGKEPVVVKGAVAAKEVRQYLVRAKTGQLMTVHLQSPGQTATFAVYSSHGEIVSGLTDWSAKLPRDGDYRIRIVTSHNSGTTDYSMRIALQ